MNCVESGAPRAPPNRAGAEARKLDAMADKQELPPSVQRFCRWLMTGTGMSRGSAAYVGLQPQRLHNVPIRILQVLARRRSAQPVPMLYVVVGAAGTVTGTILHRYTGLRWWVPPVALIGGTWTFFLSSIWWKEGLHPTKLSTELLSVLNPPRGIARERRENIERLMSSEIPMLGFIGLDEEPKVSGMSWSGEGIYEVRIRYSDEFKVVATDARHVAEESGMESASGLIEEVRINRLIAGAATVDEHNAFIESVRSADIEMEWRETTLRIDEESLPAWQAELDSVTATYSRFGEYWIAALAPAESTTLALYTLDGPPD